MSNENSKVLKFYNKEVIHLYTRKYPTNQFRDMIFEIFENLVYGIKVIPFNFPSPLGRHFYFTHSSSKTHTYIFKENFIRLCYISFSKQICFL